MSTKRVYIVQYYASREVLAVFDSQDEAWTFAEELDPDAKVLTVDEYKVHPDAQEAIGFYFLKETI